MRAADKEYLLLAAFFLGRKGQQLAVGSAEAALHMSFLSLAFRELSLEESTILDHLTMSSCGKLQPLDSSMFRIEPWCCGLNNLSGLVI
ncbi:hypothetical protein F2Q69_00059811 [Brassica cretica]|uniref:Uncharacterized protein n=1 Tax=Brassica cretica TaxID=69181 RepID=A0A8S9RD84_BRACR|nr:hypothetical protein F2Q69_00059811 [Brassica cretica]